jgi:hypothetical protein
MGDDMGRCLKERKAMASRIMINQKEENPIRKKIVPAK